MTRIHIAHVVLSLRPGGLENGVVNVVNGLPAGRFVSSVYCLQEAGEFSRRIRAEDCRIREYGLQPGNDLRLPFRLARDLRRDGVDVVHTRNSESFFYGFAAARLANIARVIHSEHGRTGTESILRRLLQGWMLRRTNAAFAVSRELARRLEVELRLPDGTFSVLYNGVDLARFVKCDGIPRQDSGLPVTIGSVGRMVEVKNYPLLLRAFAELRKDTDARLLLVGEGPQRRSLESLAVELGISAHTEFVGHSEDVARYMQQMDVFVLPSTWEGLSNTVLEAMACGLTVAASDVGGNSELVVDGKSGYLFPSGDMASLAARLRALVRDADLRRRMGAEAQLRAQSEFSMQAMLQRYAALYDQARPGKLP